MFAYQGYISSSIETAPRREDYASKTLGMSVRCVKLE